MNMRSPLWFVVAAVVGVAGLVAAYFYVMPRIATFSGGLQQVVMPGPVTLNLDRAGPYTIYAETNSMIDGRLYDRPPPGGARLTLTYEATGEEVPLVAPHGSVEYAIGARKGHAILGFTIERAGQYRLVSSTSADAKFVLALAHGTAMGSVGQLFGTVVIALTLGLGGLGIAGIIVAITVIQRDKARRTKA